jgi:hypothetical protein
MDLFRGGAGKAMTISLLLMVYQQFSGINAVIFYSGKVVAVKPNPLPTDPLISACRSLKTQA